MRDWRILTGDWIEMLKTLPDNSVHCVVTSPPYWGLRDYGVPGQLGLERTPEEYVAKMVEGFREVRRVLREDGTCWVNLGDAYANDGKWGGTTGGKHAAALHGEPIGRGKRHTALKPKDLCGIPWRVAFAFQADGWWLRQDIVWSKPNPMPESVTDRCTKAHEYLFLLTKRERYFYDAEAVKEPVTEATLVDRVDTGRFRPDRGFAGGPPSAGCGRLGSDPTRNKRSVWTVTTAPFPEAHFATFPPKLVEPCILAGTSEKGCCPQCGAPWERIVEKSVRFESGSGKAGNPPNGKNGDEYEQALSGDYDIRMGPVTETRTLGWQPTCKCPRAYEAGGEQHDIEPVPCTVLDPFSGAGTTGLVATRMGRNFIGIELNPQYVAMAERRILGDAPLFNTVLDVSTTSGQEPLRVEEQDTK